MAAFVSCSSVPRRHISRRLTRCALSGACLALLAVPAGATAAAITPAGAIAELNAERGASGLPHAIVERPDWSAACAHHDAYERTNGGQLTHDESSSMPGYTSDGAWAGQNSVLSQGTPWSATANPWETAPIHLGQLFAPRLAQMGVDETPDAFDCATTWPGMVGPPPAASVVYAFPGQGVGNVPASETANESPFVPGDFVGLPRGAATGPHLFVWADAPGIDGRPSTKVLAATLTGPQGAIEVRWVDQTTQTIGPYLTGGVLIPVTPLAPATTYAAHVQVELLDTQAVLTRDWSFTTAGLDPAATLRFTRGRLRLTSRNPAPASVRATLPSRRSIRRTLDPGRSLALPPGHWNACVTQPLSAPYAAFSRCVRADVTAHPRLRLLGGSVRDGRVRFGVSADRALAGRRATIRIGSGRAITRRLRRGTQTLSLRAPRGAGRVRVRIRAAAFSTRDVPYAAASASRRYA